MQPNYAIINPNTQLPLEATCLSGCENASSIVYSFQVYKKSNLTTVGDMYIPYIMPNSGFDLTIGIEKLFIKIQQALKY
jgi:hypothetical protein